MPYKFNSTPEKWEIDANGFMRCRCRFLSTGIMQYNPSELGMDGVNPLNIMVDLDALSDPHALRSLEGMPVLAYDHEWLTPDKEHPTVGSIAGTPRVNGPFLEGEIVVTDPKAIQSIRDGLLSDISSAYNASYIMEPGSYEDEFFDGKQAKLRYNHIALLKPGEGRAGESVRVLNKEGTKKMSNEVTAIQLKSGKIIRVLNEDVHTMNAEIKETEDKAKETENESTASMEDVLGQLETKNAELETMNAEIGELKGKLEAMAERMNEALSPEQIEEVAKEMAEETDEAKELLTANQADEEKTMNSIKGLHGHELRVAVINSIRTKNSAPELEEEASKDENFVKGVYSVYKDAPVKTSNKKSVAGADVVNAKTENSGTGFVKPEGTKRLGY